MSAGLVVPEYSLKMVKEETCPQHMECSKEQREELITTIFILNIINPRELCVTIVDYAGCMHPIPLIVFPPFRDPNVIDKIKWFCEMKFGINLDRLNEKEDNEVNTMTRYGQMPSTTLMEKAKGLATAISELDNCTIA